MMILFAPNVNCGGGLVLLLDLLRALSAKDATTLVLDQRIKEIAGPLVGEFPVTWVKRSFWHRLRTERKLSKMCGQQDFILCFHGVPPVFSCKAQVAVYVQNRLLISSLRDHGFSLKVRLRLSYEKAVFFFGRKSVSRYFVQTKTMSDLVANWLAKHGVDDAESRVCIAPFADAVAGVPGPKEQSGSAEIKKFDFCYVADGQPHKNHRHLFDALATLAKQNVFPRVAVTLGDHETDLLAMIDELQERHGVKIENLGVLKHQDVFALYQTSRALIFPSLLESFGLPLIEGERMGIPIVASELNYVRDVCQPQETFNPHEPLSIARAMQRFLGLQRPSIEVLSAKQFLSLAGKQEKL